MCRPSDAEDAVQDVFLRLSRRPDVAGSNHGEAYLFKAAASVAKAKAADLPLYQPWAGPAARG